MSTPPPCLHISKKISDKIFYKHQISDDEARGIFEAHWESAEPHPFDPSDPPPDDSDPKFVIQYWDPVCLRYWFLVFSLYSLEEAELVTCYKVAIKKRWPSFWRTR